MTISRCLDDFVSNIKYSLCAKFYKDTNGIELKTIYPFLFNDINVNIKKQDETIELININELLNNTIELDNKKKYGVYYTTSDFLIDTMINKVDILSGKILEPSCGSGSFLIKIVNKIVYELKQKDFDSIYILKYIVNNVYANDIDENILEIAELNVLTTLYQLIVMAVNENKKFKMDRLKFSNNDFVQKDSFKDFDLVIGNPPFVTMYGKRSKNMNEEKRAYYNTFDFVQKKTANNKFNLSMFFIENGLKALNKKGKLFFILDVSFFETAYIDLRKYILENYSIKFIGVGLKEFQNVISGQIILLIENSQNISDDIIWHDYYKNIDLQIKQEKWLNDAPKFQFLPPYNDKEEKINSKIKKHKRLDYYFPKKMLRTCCALTGRTEDFLVDKNSLVNCEILPYIEGAKGLNCKFGSLSTIKFIKYDYELQLKISEEFKIELTKLGIKNKKRVTLGDLDVYKSPKVFIRQSASEIIATYTEKKYAANNSIYVLSTKKSDTESILLLKYTCGILNSEISTFYARLNNIIRMAEGKTPQIKISDLKDIRIPFSQKYFNKVVTIVDGLQNDPQNKDLMKELNEIVYQMFDIDENEKLIIKNYINKKMA